MPQPGQDGVGESAELQLREVVGVSVRSTAARFPASWSGRSAPRITMLRAAGL
jgi:hypothetical protein